MISSTAASGSMISSKKTFFKLLAAPINADMGEVTMTAPSVPPSTMIAAVTWVTSETLPPSITNPPMMPPNATTSPRMLAKSGRADRRFGLARGFASQPLDRGSPIAILTAGLAPGTTRGLSRLIAKQGLPETDDPLNDLLGGLQNHIFLTRGKRDHRIRRHLDVFDQI